MIEVIKRTYRKFKKSYVLFMSVNWIKTLYFNYKKFPYYIAKKLPVYFYGRVKFSNISGKVVIDTPIKRGMIGFGQRYEMSTVSNRTAEVNIQGEFVFKGHVQFGKDYFIFIKKNAYCELGHMSSMASNGKIICTHKVTLGDFARLGSESQIIDTNFHQLIDTLTNEKLPMSSPIEIGNYNFIGNRVSIMSKTKTPNYCIIASNSLCNKNFTDLDENTMIGGMPARLIRSNITRDWKGEENRLLKNLILYP